MDAEKERKLRQLLTSWEINQETINNFIAQEMDLFALEHMNSDSFRNPITTEGARIRFRMRHEAWLKSLRSQKDGTHAVQCVSGTSATNSAAVSSCVTRNLTYDQNSELPCSVLNIPGSKILQADLNGNLFLDEFPNCFMEGDDVVVNDKENQPTDKGDAGTLSSPVPVLDSPETGKSTALKEKVEIEPPQPKRIKAYDLMQVLKGTSDGKKVLSLYEKDKEFIKDSTRDELVDCILDEETRDDLGKSVPRDRLKFFAGEIVKLFPTEKESTFYDFSLNPRTQKTQASGKLVWRFYNRRRNFVKCGAIPPRVKASQPQIRSSSLKNVTIDKSTEGSMLWLEQNRGNKGNWEEVLQHWNKTSVARLNLLTSEAELGEEEIETSDDKDEGSTAGKKRGKKQKTSGKTFKISEKIRHKAAHHFLTKYPALQENTGYMLFEIDFKTLQPDGNTLAFFTEWATLSAFIVEQVRKKDGSFLQDATLTNGEKNLTVLRNISKLFPIVTISGEKRGKKTWRPSHAEAADAFVLMVPSTLALEETKDQRREMLVKHRMHMQPFVAVVGDIENPLQFLVCIDEFTYEVDSIVQAVDVVFKSFFALNYLYPPEAEQVWLFLQRSVYCFTTAYDSVFSGVDTRVAEYARFKKRLDEASL